MTTRILKFYLLWGALSLLLFMGSCKPKEDVVLRGIRDIVIDASPEPILRANAILYNPNNVRMKLRKINVDVYVDGKKSARIDQETKTVIPAVAEFIIPLEVKINIKELGLLDTIFGVISGKKMKVEYKGDISVTYRGIPFRVPVDHKSEVRIKL